MKTDDLRNKLVPLQADFAQLEHFIEEHGLALTEPAYSLIPSIRRQLNELAAHEDAPSWKEICQTMGCMNLAIDGAFHCAWCIDANKAAFLRG